MMHETTTSQAGLSVRGLTVERGGSVVIHNVSLDVGAGEAVAVTGRNGVGKSSLLLAVAEQIPRRTGTVEWRDHRGPRPYPASGLLLQGGRVFRSLSVAENLAVAARGLPRRERDERTALFTDTLPLLRTHRSRHAGSLSGGERQSVGLAMVLMQAPRLLLLDEPAAGVDAETTTRIAALLTEVKQQWQAAILFVEHRERFIAQCADRVIHLGTATNASSDEGTRRAWQDPRIQEHMVETRHSVRAVQQEEQESQQQTSLGRPKC
jgi:ABC-type branched-subunit amino acid transport system ATPase component